MMSKSMNPQWARMKITLSRLLHFLSLIGTRNDYYWPGGRCSMRNAWFVSGVVARHRAIPVAGATAALRGEEVSDA